MNDENQCLRYTGKLAEASVISILESTAADGKKPLKFSDFDREIKRLGGKSTKSFATCTTASTTPQRWAEHLKNAWQ